MTTPPPDAPLPVPPGEPPAATLEMAEVVAAIFRMFDGHIDVAAATHASEPPALGLEAHAAVPLVGASG